MGNARKAPTARVSGTRATVTGLDTGTMASEILGWALRRHLIKMTSAGQSSHVGSGLSLADVMAVLYGGVLRFHPDEPLWSKRDRVILSKGHAGALLYAALAESGFFPVDRLKSHYQNGSSLSGHVSHKTVPGVDVSTGSLGHGLSIGAGFALNSARRGLGFRTYVMMSDGECDEGSVWEAAMFAAHHRLSSLVAIVDYNKMQSLGSTTATLDLEPFAAKWQAFGWHVVEVNGHDHAALASALQITPEAGGLPRCVIAHTTKGKGVSFMEHQVLWHYRAPDPQEHQRALLELGEFH